MVAEDSGIVRRGLMLLGLIGIVAVTVLFILFRQGGPATARAESRPELSIASLAVPGAGFPLCINWGSLHDLGQSLPSSPGWETRYTATRVLAHRGSPRVPVPILCEMLDEDRQMRNFRTQLPDGREVADEAAAYQELLIALKAVAEWRKNAKGWLVLPLPGGFVWVEKGTYFLPDGPDIAEMERLFHAVDKLTRSGNNVVRSRAQEVVLALTPKIEPKE